MAALPDHVTFVHSGKVSMQELQQQVAALDTNTLVLLGAFTTDKNNHHFSFSESAELITSSSSRPVLSFWDFYLGHGITGGVITKGYDQGKIAATLALEILQGRDIVTLPVVEKNPVTPTVDYQVLSQFGVPVKAIPPHVRIVNNPQSFFEQRKNVIYTIITIVGLLIILVSILTVKVFIQKRTHRQLSKKAERDPLTGVKNRAFFDRSLQEHIENAIAKQQPLILCYFDLDNLKIINDTLGHTSGDDYILQAVGSIRKHIRTDDITCRLGGDEFAVILPNYVAQQAATLCQNINIELRDSSLASTCNIGISFGFSQFEPANPISAEHMIAEADKRMYIEKQNRKIPV